MMPIPPPKRAAATELEVRITAGDVSAVGALVSLLDSPLHGYLANRFGSALCQADREDLIADFIADLVADPLVYDAARGSIEQLAVARVGSAALDLLRHRGVKNRHARRSARSETECPSARSSAELAAQAAEVQRIRKCFDSLSEQDRDVLDAYRRFGRDGYKQAMFIQFNVTGAVAATRLARARRRLSEALGPRVRLDP